MKTKMKCFNRACIFLKKTRCNSDYYNLIQACAYRIEEVKENAT